MVRILINIHLIGTVHNDLDGKGRLERALACEKPDILTVEGSREYFDYLKGNRKSHIAFCLKKFEEKGVLNKGNRTFWMKSFRSLPFEFPVCVDYAKSNAIPIYFVDETPENIGNVFRIAIGIVLGSKKDLDYLKRLDYNILKEDVRANFNLFRSFHLCTCPQSQVSKSSSRSITVKGARRL